MSSEIRWSETAADLTASRLHGFFDGWPDPPSAETLLRVLRGSSHVVIAIDAASGDVVGFVTATSDGALSACIPLLEVRRDRRGRGLGTELMTRMLARLEPLYMVDLSCDPELQPFYERLGMIRGTGMMLRNRAALRLPNV